MQAQAGVCTQHPQSLTVGVCGICLRERLNSLIECVNPATSGLHEAYVNGIPTDQGHARGYGYHEARPQFTVASSSSAVTYDTIPEDLQTDTANTTTTRTTSASTAHEASVSAPEGCRTVECHEASRKQAPEASRSLEFHEASLKQAVEGSRNVNLHETPRRQTSGGSRSEDLHEASRKQAIETSRSLDCHESSRIQPTEGSRPVQDIHEGSKKQVSVSDQHSDPRSAQKKISSWFSLPKLKQESKKDQLKGQQSFGKKLSASGFANKSGYRADLVAIAETGHGDLASDASLSNGSLSTSSSWLSSFFHRRKETRSSSNLSNNSISNVSREEICDRDSIFGQGDGNFCGGDVNLATVDEAGKASAMDSSRLSVDGARPDLKKKLEADGEQRRDSSAAFAMKNDTRPEQPLSLQRCKSVASVRSSISVQMPKDLMHSTAPPMIQQKGKQHQNPGLGINHEIENNDATFRRSRSWGRAWSRALSPLLGLKQHGHSRNTEESPSSKCARERCRCRHHHCTSTTQNAGYFTPNHVYCKTSPTPSSSSYLSPLRRNNHHVLDSRIHSAQ